MWQFSSYSEPLVQKLLQAAVKLDNNNEWSQRFGHVNERILDQVKVQMVHVTDIKPDKEIHEEEMVVCETVEDKSPERNTFDENFCNTIEKETAGLDYMIEECLKRPNLISDLAKHLSVSAIEKVFKAIFAKDMINEKFISLFLETFFPIFIKREPTRLSLDLLVKASNAYPEAFELVLIKLIKDVNIKSSILQELIQVMGAEFQKHLLFLIMHVNFSSEMFVHHSHTLYLAYTNCQKTENLQNFIQSKLLENASNCTNDKNYGRLFLAFLQAQRCIGFCTDLTLLGSCISQHDTPFKQPCLKIIKEMMENNLK